MRNQLPTITPARYTPQTYRTTARIVGGLYLAGMVVGISGLALIQSLMTAPDHLGAVAANSMLLAAGVVLWLLTVVGDAAHGVLMFPVLKRHSERAAIGYLAARIADAIFIAVMALVILVKVPVAAEYLKAGSSDTSYLQSLSEVFTHTQLYAYEFGMTAVGVAGLILCSTFYRSGLIPRLLAGWGLVGYATLLFGSVAQILGFNLNSIHVIPGGLWEVFIGVWLIVKGFSSVPALFEPSTSTTESAKTLASASPMS